MDGEDLVEASTVAAGSGCSDDVRDVTPLLRVKADTDQRLVADAAAITSAPNVCFILFTVTNLRKNDYKFATVTPML